MKISHYLFLLAFAIGISSCNSGPSLEKYYVKKSESPDFMTVDIASSIIKANPKNITAEQADALERIEKLNVLMFKRNPKNLADYKAEKDSVAGILKSGNYDPLMKIGSGKNGASIYMKGKEEKTDEFVVNAYSEENGFAVIRLLGDEMTMNDIMAVLSLLKQSDFDVEELKPLQEMLKNQP